MTEAIEITRDMLSFIERSPSCFHVINNAAQMLEAAGYCRLLESEDWELFAGGKYYVERNGSSMLAFEIPSFGIGKEKKRTEAPEEVKGFHIVATHSDSPCFKLKEAPEIQVEEHYVKLNTEKYGGMILSTWLDRPLSVAGRLVTADANGLQSHLVHINRELLVIPNIAIHMNRNMNQGVEYNPQKDMLPLFSDSSLEHTVKWSSLVAEAAGVEEETVLGQDLFLYVHEKGRLIGAGQEFVLSPRLDDLQCVYASLRALIESASSSRAESEVCGGGYVKVCAVFDNEEVGSNTRQGADSSFLEDVLYRIAQKLGADRTDFLRWLAGSFLISADNAHAVHPNYPEKADPTNRPYLNGGIVIKYHGSQKYTTDAFSAAQMKQLCRRAQVPFQTYANRSDIAGGSTLGNISTAHVSVASVDIGLPQLAMHSAVETAGTRDTAYAVRVLKTFWEE